MFRRTAQGVQQYGNGPSQGTGGVHGSVLRIQEAVQRAKQSFQDAAPGTLYLSNRAGQLKQIDIGDLAQIQQDHFGMKGCGE